MMARLEKALWIGLGSGLLDAAFGLTSLGLSLGHLAGVLVVVALHQLIAVTLAALVWLMAPELGDRMAPWWRDVRGSASGGDGELGAALAWVVWALAVPAGWALSAAVFAALQGRFATALYEHILQVLGVVAALTLTGGVAWRIAFGLRRLPQRGPLTRARVLGLAAAFGCLAYAALWIWRDLFFKEISPAIGVVLGVTLWGALFAQWPTPAQRVRASLVVAAAALLVVGWVGDWTSAAPMLRRGAPGSGVVVRALDRLTDWDGDGVASHFGAKDCAPFDPRIFPGSVDLPDDGVDQDCYRGDLKSTDVAVDRENDLPAVGNLRRPKKIVLVSIDALRPDHLGAYGYTRHATSPNLDRWASEAVVFDNAYTSGPYTIAAIPGLLTARGISQIPNYIAEKGSYKLADELKTLPELLRKMGYRTGAVTSGLDPRGNGFGQGLDHLKVVTKGKADTADAVTRYARHWLTKTGDREGFLWLHYFDPHDPYQRKKGFDFGAAPVDRYDASIAFMDQHLGPLLEEISSDPDHVVVLVADHGEAFGEHGATNHGTNIYRENARIPMIIRWGGASAQRHQGAVSILDVMPTLLQLAGAERAPGFGQSLVPQLLGEPADLSRGVLTESYRKGQLFGLSTGTQRLIYFQDEARYERYDIVEDPAELTDLFGRDPVADERLERQLYNHLTKGVLLRRGLTVQRMLTQVLPPGVRMAEPQRFGDALELVGVRWFVGGKSPDKPEYILSLYWRALKKMERSWRIAVGIRSGKSSVNRDHTPGYGYVPGRGTYPTNQWPVGQVIEDQVVVGRLDKLGVQDRSISVGVYSGTDKLLPAQGAFRQNERGTRVIVREFKKLKPLIWGQFNRRKVKP